MKLKTVKPVTIGILAGMGPRSTSFFLERLLDECQKQYGPKYDEDFPHILIYSLPTPFFVDKPIDHEAMEKTLCEGIKRLESAGVDFIVVPCNTAHIYFNPLKKSVSVPILNIIEETIKQIPTQAKNATILSTEPTFQSMLYQKAITSSGHTFVFKKDWQRKINKIIFQVKQKKISSAQKSLALFLKELKRENVETIIIACTDLSILQWGKSFNVVDSSLALAKETIKEYCKRVKIK